MNAGISPSLCDVASSTFRWPQTTSPWVVTTAVVNAHQPGAQLQTMFAASGLEMASSLAGSRCMLLSIECYLIDRGRWRKRNVLEMAVGRIGEADVAVFLDDQGNHFCPDAPDLPVVHIAALVSAGSVAVRSAATNSAPSRATPGEELRWAISQMIPLGDVSLGLACDTRRSFAADGARVRLVEDVPQ